MQLSLLQGRAAMPMLRSRGVQPLHKHGCSSQRVIQIMNAHRTTSIADCFWQRVGRPLNPLIPLYNVPPPRDVDNDETDLMVVKINNPPGDAKECDDDWVVLFDVLTALPALDKPLEDDNDDDALPTALGLSTNGSNAVALTTVSLAADRIGAPPALAEDDNAAGAGPGSVDRIPVGDCDTGNDGALGPPAKGSAVPPALTAAPAISTRRAAPLALPNTLRSPANANGFAGGHVPSKGAGASAEDDNAMCAGSGGVNGIPVGNCTTGDDGALGPPANGSTVPPALVAAPVITTRSVAPLALPDALGSPASANSLAGEHKAMDKGSGGNTCAAVVDGAEGVSLPSPMATGGADPSASHTALDGSDDEGDAPPEFSANVGLPAKESGSMGSGNAMDAGSSSIGDDPTQQSSALYSLFCHGIVEAGWQPVVAVGWMWTALWESHPQAAVTLLPVNAGQDATGVLPAGRITKGDAQCALDSTRAGRTTKGVALQALGPLPSCAVVDTAGTAAALVARPGTAVCMDGCASGTCTGGHVRTFIPATIIAAIAPAVTNPYTHSAHGTVADMGGAAGGAIGDVVAPDDATSAMAGVAPESNTPPASSFVQGAHGHSLPSTFGKAELHNADP
jgi:hypothetical protein